MQKFIDLGRVEAPKREVADRIDDFNEIFEVIKRNQASSQASRCIQCGDPYCHNRCPLHNYIPYWLRSTTDMDLELSFKLSNETNPFPEITGRVCPQERLCEGACTLNDGYGAMTIAKYRDFYI